MYYDQTLRRTLQSITFANTVEPKMSTSINIKFKAECINWSVYLYKDVMLSYIAFKFLLPNTLHRINFYNAGLPSSPHFRFTHYITETHGSQPVPSSQTDKGLKKRDGLISNLFVNSNVFINLYQ